MTKTSINSGLYIDLMAPLHPMLAIAFINFILLLYVFMASMSFFAQPSKFEIRMPVLSSGYSDQGRYSTITINSENVLYFNNKVITANELKKELLRLKSNALIYIRADRRSSMWRMADIWEMCKGLSGVQVKIVIFEDKQ